MQPIPYVIEATIQRASQASGIDLGFLLHAARRESGYDPDAKARSSSATGLYQFVDQTWLATLKRHGAKYGYARYAALIGQGADGRYYVNGAEARRVVMGLRLDPHAASLMAGELAADHASYLRGRTGRNPTTGELYAAHFLGPQGSARLIEARRATPGADAAAMFPDAAAANRAIFYRNGRAATVAEVYADLTRTDGPRIGFVQYASARRREKLAERTPFDIALRGPIDAGQGRPIGRPGPLLSVSVVALAGAGDRRPGQTS